MKTKIQNDIRTQDIISTAELLIMFKWTANTIRIIGTHITIHEFNINLNGSNGVQKKKDKEDKEFEINTEISLFDNEETAFSRCLSE